MAVSLYIIGIIIICIGVIGGICFITSAPPEPIFIQDSADLIQSIVREFIINWGITGIFGSFITGFFFIFLGYTANKLSNIQKIMDIYLTRISRSSTSLKEIDSKTNINASEVQKESLEESVQPFFDLSTPENVVRSFVEAIVLKDKNRAAQCWHQLPKYISDLTTELMKELREKCPEMDSLLQSDEVDFKEVKKQLNRLSYGKERLESGDFRVWWIAPNGDISSCFKVRKKNAEWKVIM